MVGNRGTGCFLTVWVIGWTASTLFFDGLTIFSIYRQARSGDFSSTKGRITHSGIKHGTDVGSARHEVDVRYDYAVGDQPRTGDRYRFNTLGTNKETVRAIVAELPVGLEVDVFYDPDQPDVSVLRAGIEGGDVMLPMFLMPFNIIMLGSYWFFTGRDRGLSNPVRYVDEKIHVRLPAAGPLIYGGATLGLSAFVMIFAVGATAGSNPSLVVAVSVWVGVILLATFVALRRQAQLSAGLCDVIIEPLRGRLTLPVGEGRTESLSLPTVKLTVAVETFDPEEFEEGEQPRFPVIVRAGDDEIHDVTDFATEAEAQHLANILREQLGLRE